MFFSCFMFRSPSPEPIYSSDGKRLNTREFRVRKRLEEQRHSFIMKMQSINPEFKPPIDYKYDFLQIFSRHVTNSFVYF